MIWTLPVVTAVIFNRPQLPHGNSGGIPYPDAKERHLLRQRVYNQRYYRRNRKLILAQKKRRKDVR